MMFASSILKQFYAPNSLKNVAGGIKFTIKNCLSVIQLAGLKAVKISGYTVPLGDISVLLDNGKRIAPSKISVDHPLHHSLDIFCAIPHMDKGKHVLAITFLVEPLGELTLDVEDSISGGDTPRVGIPRDKKGDYSEKAIPSRIKYVQAHTGVELRQSPYYGFDSHVANGNCELLYWGGTSSSGYCWAD